MCTVMKEERLTLSKPQWVTSYCRQVQTLVLIMDARRKDTHSDLAFEEIKHQAGLRGAFIEHLGACWQVYLTMYVLFILISSCDRHWFTRLVYYPTLLYKDAILFHAVPTSNGPPGVEIDLPWTKWAVL